MAIPSTLVFFPLFLLLMFWTIYLQFEYVETSTKKTFERVPVGNRGQMQKNCSHPGVRKGRTCPLGMCLIIYPIHLRNSFAIIF